MAQRKPKLPFGSVTLQPKSITPGGVTRTGAPINIGSNARQIASLLSETSSKLRNLGLTEEQKQQEISKISAQEEFLAAKRENTLETLRKATLSGEIPEGMSPSYNDYRKVLLAKDAIENGYQNVLNQNLGVLVDPDVPQEHKAAILTKAYADTGIDDLQMDPISKGIVLKSLSKVQSNFDSVSREKAAEVNMSKMQQAIDKDAINVINNYNGNNDGLLDSLKTSIDIAKKAAVKEPTKQVLSTYLRQIDTLASKDADRALMALDALEDSSTEDGAPLAGNVDIAAGLIKSREAIENTIYQETVSANKELNMQRNQILKGLESKLTASDMDDPEKIAQTFDSFLQEQKSLPTGQQLPLTVVNDIAKERDALVNQARKVRNGDTFELYAKQQELDSLSNSYSSQAISAGSQEELDELITGIQDRDYLTLKDKTFLVNKVNMAKSAFEFSTSEYKPDQILAEGGYTPEALDILRVQFSATPEDMDDTIGHLKEFGVTIYNQKFTETLNQLAAANNLTPEQALTSNKSFYVQEDKTELPEGALDASRREGMLLDKSSNLVKQASDAARAATLEYMDSALSTNMSLWKAKENLAADAITDSLSAVNAENINMYKNSETVQHMSDGAKGIARNTIVLTRGNLMRLADKLKSITGFAESDATGKPPAAKTWNEYLSIKDSTDKYYKMQNMLGYSLKEIINGKSLAGMPLDYNKIDPATVQIVWNERELVFMENMSDAQGAELAEKFGLGSFEELLVIQRDLMENR